MRRRTALALAGVALTACAGLATTPAAHAASGPCPAAEITALWYGGTSHDSRCDHLGEDYFSHLYYNGHALSTAQRYTYQERAVLVQLRLRDLRYRPITIDGYYGPAQTAPAVKRFQRNHGLVIDGVVGPQTWEALFGLGEY
ncbi:MAG: peptidoglycan-binding domain-containing protein [Sporichthyaceae bacterium]